MSNGDIPIFPLMLIRTAGLPLRWLDDLAVAWPEETSRKTDPADKVRKAFDAALSALDASPLRTAVYNARKDFFQRRKLPSAAFDQLLHSAPEQPEIAQLIDFLDIYMSTNASNTVFAQRYDDALRANYQVLQRAAQSDTLRRALLFASHDLLDRLASFSEKPAGDFNKKDRQTALSLLQYLGRATAKTSPLSRFTTVSLWQDRAEADLFSAPKAIVTPNVSLLPLIYEVLLREPSFYRSLAVVLNPCVSHPHAREYRSALDHSDEKDALGMEKNSVFNSTPDEKGNTNLPPLGGAGKEWLYFDGEQESFQQMENNPVAGFVTNTLLESGRILPFVELISRLESEVEAGREQLQSLVFELIDIGLLEWELPEKGLSPGWCGALYHYLAFLPEQPPVIVEAADLLRHLNATARTLPHQPVMQAQAAILETAGRLNEFFGRRGFPAPSLPPEQIFFEDVEEPVTVQAPAETIRSLALELAECWKEKCDYQLPAFYSRLYAFARKHLAEGQSLDFLTFSKDFLSEKPAEAEGTGTSDYRGKIGALMQIFRAEDGTFQAVVNGLFPGGGKLFARWLHLFPTTVQEALREWNDAIPFPWQGWTNANFQPAMSKNILAVPGGRTASLSGGKRTLFGNLRLKREAEKIRLIDGETGLPVTFTDLGLEASKSKPPVMQILWRLGVPYVSLEILLQGWQDWEQQEQGWRFRPRITRGALVLSRASWQIQPDIAMGWLNEKDETAIFRRIRTEMSARGVPRRFFAQFLLEKPQYFDLDSPLFMLLFIKTLRQKKSPVLLTEMLPLPEQCVVWKEGSRAAEIVLEFEV